MRAPSFSNAAWVAGLSVLLCASAPGPALADVGGGKGYPATPWRVTAVDVPLIDLRRRVCRHSLVNVYV